MPREISIHELSGAELWDELSCLTQKLRDSGHERCLVLFAWAWGIEYYPKERWDYEDVLLTELEALVRRAEETTSGEVGSDDLFITLPPTGQEVCFCHHSGIHLSLEHEDSFTSSLIARWESKGYEPKEGMCSPRF